MTDSDLQEFWTAHEPRIHARCYRILQDRAAAEDATQETFIRLKTNQSRIPEHPVEARAWVYRIATNFCLNEVRNRGRRPELWAELPERIDGSGMLPQRSDRVEEAFANRQLVHSIRARMAAKLGDVAWLYHVTGMDQQEVADALGVSRRTVVARLSRFVACSRKLIAATA